MANKNLRLGYVVILLLSSLSMTQWLSVILTPSSTIEYLTVNSFIDFSLILSLHLLCFLLLRNMVNEIWSVVLTIVSLSSYDGFPFRKFLSTFFIESQFPENPRHIIFDDWSIALCAILSVICILSSISRRYNLEINAVGSALLILCISFLSSLDAVFLSLFFAVYWSIKFILKGKKYFGIAALIFGVLVVGICITEIMQSVCENNCIQPVNFYYLFAYITLPFVLLAFVYLVYPVDPYELFIKFRTLFAFASLELIVVLTANSTSAATNVVIPNFILGQTILHVLYYTPVIYYVGRHIEVPNVVYASSYVLRNLRTMLTALFYTYHREVICAVITLFLLYNWFNNRL